MTYIVKYTTLGGFSISEISESELLLQFKEITQQIGQKVNLFRKSNFLPPNISEKNEMCLHLLHPPRLRA